MKNLVLLFLFFVGSFGFSQQTDYVDFKKIKADIDFDISQKKVSGDITYTLKFNKSVDSIFINANDMRFMSVRVFFKGMNWDNHHRGKVNYNYDGQKLWVIYDFEKKKEYQLRLRYFTNPKKALYFIDWTNPSASSGQVWTQGQGKYTSNWLPSIDDMNEKIEFDLSITFDKDYEIISNGKLIKTEDYFGEKKWHYDMQKPMSSYLVALAIGKYNKKLEYSKTGVPLEMYYYPEDSLKFEPTYRYTKQMFDFLEEEISIPYPWQNYKQVPVKDFLYAGMENTGTTIFADSFVTDSIGFVDKNYVNVNAHELAHQWFGNLVTAKSGKHHWLQEGFATYYALLAEKDIFGEDYYYWRLYEYAQELLEQDKAGGSTSLLNPKSSSTTFYKKGAWVLHILREKVGDKAFKRAVKKYLKKHKFKNVETNDFISEVEKASGEDLTYFRRILQDSDDSFFEDISMLMKFKRLYKSAGIDYVDCPVGVDFVQFKNEQNKIKLKKIFDSINSQTKVEFFNELLNDSLVNKIDLYNKIFDSKDIKVRQAIAKSLSKIPLELKADYESLLDDKSYITTEIALFNLWNNFPDEQNKYLNKIKGIVGFNDKNVRTLWLTLALISDDFEPENNERYFNELLDYTSSKYGFEVRMNAFSYLAWIQSCGEVCQDNLKQATKHHNWRFSKFAKDLLKNIVGKN